MAQVKDNIVTEGFSGKLGNKIVFRQLGNRTVVTKHARKHEIKSEALAAHHQRFRKAAAYAKMKMLDPAAKAEYEMLSKQYELTTPYATAVADYIMQPDIDDINTENYSGQPGDIILITSRKVLKITSLEVSIIHPDGTVLEKGAAIFSPADAAWRHVTTAAATVTSGTVIKAVATDRPGKVVTKEKVF
jgi:hypothetical protein